MNDTLKRIGYSVIAASLLLNAGYANQFMGNANKQMDDEIFSLIHLDENAFKNSQNGNSHNGFAQQLQQNVQHNLEVFSHAAGAAQKTGIKRFFVSNLVDKSSYIDIVDAKARQDAEQAVKTANSAMNTAADANKKSDQAVATAQDANQKSNQAVAVAQDANQKSNSALGYSQQAVNTAQTALGNSQQAMSTAGTALNKAEQALGVLDQAKNAAQQAEHYADLSKQYTNYNYQYAMYVYNQGNKIKNNINQINQQINQVQQQLGQAQQQVGQAQQLAQQASGYYYQIQQAAQQAEQAKNIALNYKNQTYQYKIQVQKMINDFHPTSSGGGSNYGGGSSNYGGNSGRSSYDTSYGNNSGTWKLRFVSAKISSPHSVYKSGNTKIKGKFRFYAFNNRNYPRYTNDSLIAQIIGGRLAGTYRYSTAQLIFGIPDGIKFEKDGIEITLKINPTNGVVIQSYKGPRNLNKGGEQVNEYTTTDFTRSLVAPRDVGSWMYLGNNKGSWCIAKKTIVMRQNIMHATSVKVDVPNFCVTIERYKG